MSNAPIAATAGSPMALTQATMLAVPSQSPAGAGHPSAAGSVAGMLGSLIIVVGLILALAWLARRLQGTRAARGDLLQVTGGVSVGGKERVVIVKVGGEHFLVGVAAGQVSLLHRFASVPGAMDTDETQTGADSPFAERVRELLRARKAA
ncbi:flagellar biosynthetic protein FliO [Solimonas terrae]|uniref:Flagellar protein n=1 Tax=Solimonas terrae TaxID=1396819 RepID=A0A6M2BWM4_9GAMM|nr:flagellar biosynthetic protein FliO [Solimonas terrae]NGY06908.1 flagellar biosynthetic protein FliO [Solimonas terrae]